ncbi:MAG: tail fiber protein [Sphingopyxis sp.]|jgi:microcystin-dependent protein
MRHLKAAALAMAGVSAAGIGAPALAQTYYLGQIIETGADYCPRNWVPANGQLLAIQQNTALFSLLGTTYGGNGTTNFQLPNLQGRMLIGQGQGPGLSPYVQGQVGGVENQTLTIGQLAQHTHRGAILSVNQNTNDIKPFRNAFAVTPDRQYSNVIQFDGALHAATVTVQKTGGSDPVANMSPFLVNRYCIAVQGVFPSRN